MCEKKKKKRGREKERNRKEKKNKCKGRMPFEEFKQLYQFDAQLEEEIKRGLRPSIPEDMPAMYVLKVEEEERKRKEKKEKEKCL
jgi:hypothetical protein